MRHTHETDEIFPHAYAFERGFLYPGDTRGHGVDFNEGRAAKFPHERTYLLVNRKSDGSMWNW
jgi:mannonate dehydratase